MSTTTWQRLPAEPHQPPAGAPQWRALDNGAIAANLLDVARLLEQQHANPFRVRAYQRAAATVRAEPRAMAQILRSEGLDGLDRMPDIGPRLAGAIGELVISGELSVLERLRGRDDPLRVLAEVPGLGAVLAERVHRLLDVDSLADLEVAATDGRLAALPGFSERKVDGIRQYLAGRLARWRTPPAIDVPPVEELLDVDREYRTRADDGVLPLIAPHRFNPGRLAWLPVLHTQRGERHYTALFSNTAMAHRLHRTQDWVVLYLDGSPSERPSTVVTVSGGVLAGRRVVRGREAESARAYRQPVG